MSRPAHTFVVPAYGQSPHLASCLDSLLGQTTRSRIVVCSSTPSAWLEAECERVRVDLRVRTGPAQIAADWNFAIEQIDAGPFTIAHQDDVYEARYTEECLAAAARTADYLIVFSDYREIRDGVAAGRNRLVVMKRALIELAFFPGRTVIRSHARKRCLLRFGNPVLCPSVMLDRDRVGGFRFDQRLSMNLDWDAWLNLAEREGAFCFLRRPLVRRRIHDASETTRSLREGRRWEEDRLIFERLWPAWIAALILKVYRLSYLSNG